MISQPEQIGVMELTIEHITISDCNNFPSEKSLKSSPEVFVMIENLPNSTVLFPAPFYDELHFANYE